MFSDALFRATPRFGFGRARIRSGELAPDQPIPGEATLMRQYGVARETARQAVRSLAAEGLVYVVQVRGAYVAARD